MSKAYILHTQILSVHAAITTARQSHRSSTSTIATLGYHALITPIMDQGAAINPSLAIAFSLYKRHWESYLDHCRTCIDAMGKAITCKENEAGLVDKLERGALEETKREGQERLIEMAREVFEEEVGVLEWGGGDVEVVFCEDWGGVEVY